MKFLSILSLSFIFIYHSFAQINLTPRAPFPGALRVSAISFTLNGKGYVGTGLLETTANGSDDFWEYDPVNNSWSQKASFPGGIRTDAVGFVLNNKGYVATGSGIAINITFNDLWQYDPNGNLWSQKSSLPGSARRAAVSFIANSKAYVGLGLQTSPVYAYCNDIWEYDDINDIWTQKSNFPGIGREYSFAFGIGNFGYVGCGFDNMPNLGYNDFYEYNAIADSWTQKCDVDSSLISIYGATGFSVGSFGYALGGYPYMSQNGIFLREYNVATNSWNIKGNFLSTPPYYSPMNLFSPSVFIINNIPFITQGISSGNNFFPETFQINLITGIEDAISNLSFSVYPNSFQNFLFIKPNQYNFCNASIKLINTNGELVLFKRIPNSKSIFKIETQNLESGIYILEIANDKQKETIKVFKN